MLGARVGAEAARAGGERGVGGIGSIWFGAVVGEAWDRALWAVVGLVSQPALCLPSGGQNKKLHQHLKGTCFLTHSQSIKTALVLQICVNVTSVLCNKPKYFAHPSLGKEIFQIIGQH